MKVRTQFSLIENVGGPMELRVGGAGGGLEDDSPDKVARDTLLEYGGKNAFVTSRSRSGEYTLLVGNLEDGRRFRVLAVFEPDCLLSTTLFVAYENTREFSSAATKMIRSLRGDPCPVVNS